MDQALRNEFRAYKVETEDRIKSLEGRVSELELDLTISAAKNAETRSTASTDSKK